MLMGYCEFLPVQDWEPEQHQRCPDFLHQMYCADVEVPATGLAGFVVATAIIALLAALRKSQSQILIIAAMVVEVRDPKPGLIFSCELLSASAPSPRMNWRLHIWHFHDFEMSIGARG